MYFVAESNTEYPFYKGPTWSILAKTPEEAANFVARNAKHVHPLYALGVWKDEDTYEKGELSLYEWLSPQAQERAHPIDCPVCGRQVSLVLFWSDHEDHYCGHCKNVFKVDPNTQTIIQKYDKLTVNPYHHRLRQQ